MIDVENISVIPQRKPKPNNEKPNDKMTGLNLSILTPEYKWLKFINQKIGKKKRPIQLFL